LLVDKEGVAFGEYNPEAKQRIFGFVLAVKWGDLKPNDLCDIEIEFVCNIKQRINSNYDKRILEELSHRIGHADRVGFKDLSLICTNCKDPLPLLEKIWIDKIEAVYGQYIPHGRIFDEMYGIIRFSASGNAPRLGKTSEMRMLYWYMYSCGEKVEFFGDVSHFKFIEFYLLPTYDELLKDPNIDAVHINSPIPNHAEQSLKALYAGKHVACTVPMATSIEDCMKIVKACKETGKKYMMMETVVFAREFLYVKELYEKGELGKVQFLKASHQQDMDGWPDYWPGLPPMHYATHCVGPVAGLLKLEAEYVSCFGSGTIRKELADIHNSPFAVESAHIKFKNSDLSAYVYRSLFDVARQYRESFEVYGSKKSFEWALIENEDHVLNK
jgi:hypothetical protein